MCTGIDGNILSANFDRSRLQFILTSNQFNGFNIDFVEMEYFAFVDMFMLHTSSYIYIDIHDKNVNKAVTRLVYKLRAT